MLVAFCIIAYPLHLLQRQTPLFDDFVTAVKFTVVTKRKILNYIRFANPITRFTNAVLASV